MGIEAEVKDVVVKHFQLRITLVSQESGKDVETVSERVIYCGKDAKEARGAHNIAYITAKGLLKEMAIDA